MQRSTLTNVQINTDEPVPLYCQLKSQIKTAIDKKKILPGEMVPSERNLMQKYSLSYSTVTHALRDLVEEGYIERVQGKGTFVVEPMAKNRLKKRNLHLIGLTIPHLDAHRMVYVNKIVRGAEQEARKNGFRLIVSNDEDDKGIERKHIEHFSRNGVDGLMIHYIGEAENIDCLKRLKEEEIPFVLLDRHTPYLKTDYVTGDNLSGAYAVTKKLIELGYGKIFYVGSDEKHSAVVDRRKGYERALKEANIDLRANVLGEAHFPDHIETAYRIAKDKLSAEKTPFAVFAVNPPVLLGIWRAIQDLKLNDQDVYFACFDEPSSDIPGNIPLIKVIYPIEEMGRQTVRVIMSKLNGDKKPYQISLKPELQCSLEPVMAGRR